MTAGRLTGDGIVRSDRWCHRRRLWQPHARLLDLTLATLVPIRGSAAMLGFALVGAGCSNIVPVLYTAVGRQKAMPEHVAVPAISTLGYAGILAGPAMIGLIAHMTSLPIAFLGVAILLVLVAASGRVLQV